MKKNILNTLLIGLVLSGISVSNLQAQKVGDAAPDFTLQTLKGTNFTLSEQQGKVVFIFLFGNSCPHCVANGPNTQGVYETFKSNPDFIAIGIDVWNGNSSKVVSFKNRTGISYNMALNGSSLTALYGSTYDRILVIDKEGVLRYKATSNATSTVVAKASEKIEELLMETSTGIEDKDLSSKSLLVYPNPADNQATVQTGFQAGKLVQLNLVDMSGRIIQNETFEADHTGQIILNLSNHPTGIYYLRARSEGEVKGMRVIINK